MCYVFFVTVRVCVAVGGLFVSGLCCGFDLKVGWVVVFGYAVRIWFVCNGDWFEFVVLV